VLVRRSKPDVAAPRLAAGTVEVGAVLGEQADEFRPAAAAHRVRDVGVLVRVGARFEEEPDVLEPLVVERVCERVGPVRPRPVREELFEARRARRLRRVVEGLAVVRVGARLEQHAGELGVVRDAGRAVERGHRPVLVDEARVRVRAALEQLPGEGRRRKARVADVEERRPAAWATRRVRVARPGAAEHEGRPGVVRDLGPRCQHRLGAGALPTGRGEHERLGVGLRRSDERGPAGIPLLPGEDELGVGEGRLTSLQAGERVLVAGARGADELLGLLAKLLEIHCDLPPSRPAVRGLGPEKRSVSVVRPCDEVGTALPADRVRPRGAPRC
jgi:hypothetical protein